MLTLASQYGFLLHFFGVALSSCLLLASAFSFGSGLRSPQMILPIVCIAILCARAPFLAFNAEIDPDESVFLARAAALAVDPVFWRSIDGTSSGPITNYALSLPAMLGMPLNYVSGRIVGILVYFASLFFSFLAVRTSFGSRAALASTASVTFFTSLATTRGFVCYSSELWPVLLINYAVYRTVRAVQDSGPRDSSDSIITGIVLGLVPLAKLQAVPIAGLVAIYTLITRRTFRSRVVLIAAGCIPLLLCVAGTALFDVFHHFAFSYFLTNYFSATANTYNYKNWMELFTATSKYDQNWEVYFFSSILLIVLAIPILKKLSQTEQQNALFFLGVFLISFVCVIQPGRDYPHYLLFLVFPLSWAAMAFISKAKAHYQKFAVLCLILPQLAVFGVHSAQRHMYIRGFSERPGRNGVLKASPLARQLQAEPCSLAIWGWAAHIYVENGCIPAARSVVTYYELLPKLADTSKKYYRDRFVLDVTERNPVFFIDATGKNDLFFNSEAFRHEKYPEVERLIADRYEYLSDIDGYRLYRRRGNYPSKAGTLP